MAHSFNSVFGISSGPLALFVLIFLSNLATPGVAMLMWVRGVSTCISTFGITPPLSLVKTVLH